MKKERLLIEKICELDSCKAIFKTHKTTQRYCIGKRCQVINYNNSKKKYDYVSVAKKNNNSITETEKQDFIKTIQSQEKPSQKDFCQYLNYVIKEDYSIQNKEVKIRQLSSHILCEKEYVKEYVKIVNKKIQSSNNSIGILDLTGFVGRNCNHMAMCNI